MQATDQPIAPGQAAPAIVLPAVNHDGRVSLADYRGKQAVMIGFFRGLHCPFCRRQIAVLNRARPALREHGVETLAVINTPLERARTYFSHRPMDVTLLADPDCATHRAYGVPRIGFADPGDSAPAHWPVRTPPGMFENARIDPTGELGIPAQPMQANDHLNTKDGFELTDADRVIYETHAVQLGGQFLVDRGGIVRWSWTEAPNSPTELCRFPSPDEMVAAARRLG